MELRVKSMFTEESQDATRGGWMTEMAMEQLGWSACLDF